MPVMPLDLSDYRGNFTCKAQMNARKYVGSYKMDLGYYKMDSLEY